MEEAGDGCVDLPHVCVGINDGYRELATVGRDPVLVEIVTLLQLLQSDLLLFNSIALLDSLERDLGRCPQINCKKKKYNPKLFFFYSYLVNQLVSSTLLHSRP